MVGRGVRTVLLRRRFCSDNVHDGRSAVEAPRRFGSSRHKIGCSSQAGLTSYHRRPLLVLIVTFPNKPTPKGGRRDFW